MCLCVCVCVYSMLIDFSLYCMDICTQGASSGEKKISWHSFSHYIFYFIFFIYFIFLFYFIILFFIFYFFIYSAIVFFPISPYFVFCASNVLFPIYCDQDTLSPPFFSKEIYAILYIIGLVFCIKHTYTHPYT